MTTLTLVILGLQTVLFAAWAFCAFRILFYLRRAAVARTGAQFPGPLTFLTQARIWLADEAEAGWRRTFAGLTVAMFAAIGLFALSRG